MGEGNYTVYKHTAPNGKVYIGITCQSVLARWGKDGNGYKSGHFRNAIKKYGWKNIKHDIIATGLTEEEATIAERKLIKRYHSRDPEKGYNELAGGGIGWRGMTHTDEAKEKIRQSKLGEKNPMFGKKHTQEWIEMIRKINSHPKSEETIEKMRIAQSNRSEETRKKLSDSQKKLPIRCIETGVEYSGISIAARAIGVCTANLCACLHGRRHTCGGYHWEVIEDLLEAC